MHSSRSATFAAAATLAVSLLGCKMADRLRGGGDAGAAAAAADSEYLTVDLATLQSDYRTSTAVAGPKYDGKKLRVSGVVVDTLSSDSAKWIFINTVPQDQLGGDVMDRRHVICKVKLDAQMSHGTKGAKLTVHATHDGPHPFSKNFVFHDCVVEDKPDSATADAAPSKPRELQVAPPTTPLPKLQPLYAGTFTSTFGVVKLKQKLSTPKAVTGTYPGGTLACDADGNDLLCMWREGRASGLARFDRAADGNLSGTWGKGKSWTGSGKWTMKRTAEGTMSD